jgi:hypothetical protein
MVPRAPSASTATRGAFPIATTLLLLRTMLAPLTTSNRTLVFRTNVCSFLSYLLLVYLLSFCRWQRAHHRLVCCPR